MLLLVPFLICCAGKSSPGARSDADTTASTDSLIISLKGESGKSVFEITRAGHKVDFLNSPAGVFVKAIDSLESGYYYGWIYSVNDTFGQIASDRFVTKDGDIIKWHFRKF
jgi:Domain of unknown function (DUF4430)